MKRNTPMPVLIYIIVFGMAGFFVLAGVYNVGHDRFHINMEPFMDAILPPFVVNFLVLLFIHRKDCND